MERLSRSQAIRQHCIECSGGMRGEVKNCTVKKCKLYPYRMGYEINPETGKRIIRKKKQSKDD